MVFAPFQSSSPQQFYDELELLNLEQIHNVEKAKFMYKYKKDKLPSNFNNYFQQKGENHQYNLRSKLNNIFSQSASKQSRAKEKYSMTVQKFGMTSPLQ